MQRYRKVFKKVFTIIVSDDEDVRNVKEVKKN